MFFKRALSCLLMTHLSISNSIKAQHHDADGYFIGYETYEPPHKDEEGYYIGHTLKHPSSDKNLFYILPTQKPKLLENINFDKIYDTFRTYHSQLTERNDESDRLIAEFQQEVVDSIISETESSQKLHSYSGVEAFTSIVNEEEPKIEEPHPSLAEISSSQIAEFIPENKTPQTIETAQLDTQNEKTALTPITSETDKNSLENESATIPYQDSIYTQTDENDLRCEPQEPIPPRSSFVTTMAAATIGGLLATGTLVVLFKDKKSHSSKSSSLSPPYSSQFVSDKSTSHEPSSDSCSTCRKKTSTRENIAFNFVSEAFNGDFKSGLIPFVRTPDGQILTNGSFTPSSNGQTISIIVSHPKVGDYTAGLFIPSDLTNASLNVNSNVLISDDNSTVYLPPLNAVLTPSNTISELANPFFFDQ